ncbi:MULTISPECIES: hypothetical protein [unclassified Streptomyces]|uniref:hypothetical protein n=1 Tax=unclassified Streptomyces TaxID=2593676 RepID=UPI000DD7B9BF|nr:MULTISPECIES: hypothetical protein [unclassified Streptomyces]QZZ25787.1 hypothetical protein A7X85_05565 [Streptomyces sp. ST1015]
MSDQSDRPSESAGEGPGTPGIPGLPGRWGKAIATVAALGGFGGLALFLPALGDTFGWGADGGRSEETVATPGPSGSPATTRGALPESSTTIEHPVAQGGEPVEIGFCQEFRGRSRLADGYRLWIAGRAAGEDDYVLFGEAAVSAATGDWTHTIQAGAKEQKGLVFEIFAVPVPETVSDYLLDATDYQGRHLAPHGDGSPEVGLRNTALPPDSDTRHSASIKVRRNSDSRPC